MFQSCIYFYWKIIASQHCANFCCTKMWISHMDIYTTSLLSLPPTPHLTLLGYHRAPNWTPCAIQQLPTSCLFCMVICICQYYSTSSSHSPSPAMSTSPFSVPAMKSMLNNKIFAIKNSEYGCPLKPFLMLLPLHTFCCYHSINILSQNIFWSNTP